MRILFTGAGTTDPVRDFHDGPMLHIMRQYRPDKVCVFMSREISDINQADNRFGITADFIKKHWNGYSPELELIKTDISDPSDLDAVSGPITGKVVELASVPDAEVLLNLSSGTPQMKIVLAMLAYDMRYNAIGIQVKNHEKASGRSDRTNKNDYDALAELECNEDEEENAENRCIEPRLLHLERQQKKDQVIALIEQRNYSAVYAMKNAMPDNLKALVGHLEARDSMQFELAHKRALSLRLPFNLYPKKVVKGFSDYDEVSEAYLILLNRLHRKQYEEMVLRLNPLVVRLEMRLMRSALYDIGASLDSFYCYGQDDNNGKKGHKEIIAEKLKETLPEVYKKVNVEYGKEKSGELRDSSPNVKLCFRILKYLLPEDSETIKLLYSCNELNDSYRNGLAHELKGVTREQISEACGKYPEQLLKGIGDLIASVYPECDPQVFDIYKRCGEYIKEKLV